MTPVIDLYEDQKQTKFNEEKFNEEGRVLMLERTQALSRLVNLLEANANTGNVATERLESMDSLYARLRAARAAYLVANNDRMTRMSESVFVSRK